MTTRRWRPLSQDPDDADRWSNDVLLVRRQALPRGDALVVRRRDAAPIRDWRWLQAVKNEVLGPQREAVEYFAPADRGWPVSANVRVLIAAPPPDPGFVDDGSDAADHAHVVAFPRDTRVLLDPDEAAVYAPDRLPDGFDPVTRVPLNPTLYQTAAAKDPVAAKSLRAWANQMIDGTAMRTGSGPMQQVYLSFKWADRRPEHHRAAWAAYLAAVCGPAAEGVELYPAEDRLIDASNQFHLFGIVDPVAVGALGSWTSTTDDGDRVDVDDLTGVPVDPVTGRLSVGRVERDVLTADEMDAALADAGLAGVNKARQRAWQPGLPTGPGLPNPKRNDR